MRRTVFVFVFSVACTARPPANAKLTSQSALAELKTKGAAATLRDYTSGSAQTWHSLLKQVETGDSNWLTVASQLRAVSDASYSQDLEFSVAEALIKNPSGVLRLKNFDLQRVCDVPYLEPSAKVVHDFQAQAAAALATVKDPDLQDRKKKCQAALTAP